MYKKPSNLKIVVSAIIFTFFRKQLYKKVTPQKVIRSYLLHKRVIKKDSTVYFADGIYLKENKKYFIKTWKAKIKDLQYYSLINEYIVSKILYQRLRKIQSKVIVPKPIEIIFEKSSVSTVFEYINGVGLLDSSKQVQTKCYQAIISALFKVSKSLADHEKAYFTNRTISFYMLSLPFFVLIKSLENPKSITIIIRAALDCFIQPFKIKYSKLHLAHRDLHPENIIINGKNIYLLDCENMVLTLPGYDIASIALYSDIDIKLQNLSEKTKYAIDSFFSVYISLHKLYQLDNEPFVNCYSRYLKTRYG